MKRNNIWYYAVLQYSSSLAHLHRSSNRSWCQENPPGTSNSRDNKGKEETILFTYIFLHLFMNIQIFNLQFRTWDLYLVLFWSQLITKAEVFWCYQRGIEREQWHFLMVSGRHRKRTVTFPGGFRKYRKRPVAWNRLTVHYFLKILLETSHAVTAVCFCG